MPAAALFELTRAVAAAERLEEIYSAALDCIEKTLQVPKSSILILDSAGVLRFRAWRRLSTGYRKAVEGHSPWAPDDLDPQIVVVPDVATDESLADLREIVEAEGIRSLAFVPLVANHRLLGKFMLYFDHPHEFTEVQGRQARTIASQVAFAIEHHLANREREHLAALFRSSAAGIAGFDARGRFLKVNARFCELVGRSNEELLAGGDWFSLLDDRAREEAVGQFAGLIEHGQDFALEHRLVKPDGGATWVMGTVCALRDDDDSVNGGLALVTDISPRKAAEAALLQSESRYRSLIEGVDLAVYATDAQGRITLFNEAAANLWGRRPRLGNDLWCGSWRIFEPDGTPLPHSNCPMAVTLQTRTAVRGREIIAERPDGERRWLLPHPTPLLDSNGEILGAVNVLVDITELKRVQVELRQSLVAKDDFLGMISHELRNPVVQVTGFARVLRDGWGDLPDETRATIVEDLHAASTRIQRLIENMLVVSRFERGIVPDAEPLMLQRILTETLAEFRRRCPAMVLEIDIPEDLPPILTSANTVDQVCWNLLTNAQKYGPAEGPVEVWARAVEGTVEFEVRDLGPGVPDAEFPNLFEPYFRASNTQPYASGLGLGLSVCRRLVEAHGGEMWARPRKPHGIAVGIRFKVAAGATVD